MPCCPRFAGPSPSPPSLPRPAEYNNDNHTPPYIFTQWARDQPEYAKASICKCAKAHGNPNVGPATVFLSWGLVSTFVSLVDALEQCVAEGLLDPGAFIWVCDTCIRQHEQDADQKAAKKRDVDRLDDMVRQCESTLLFNDVWDRTVKR